jgi:hypothetical protein
MGKARQKRQPRNRYNLARDIPDGVKREVRQRCGFGCVIDGSALYTYEHFDPPYKDARTHDPRGITLLCGSCQLNTTRGHLSKATIAEADANPRAVRQGYSGAVFDVGPQQPLVLLGSVAFRCIYPIVVGDEPILSTLPPEKPGLPFRLSAWLSDKNGRELLSIKDNEWRAGTSNWDVETVGRRTIIRNGKKDIGLILRMEPRETLIIEHLRMYFRGTLITCNEIEGLSFWTAQGRQQIGSIHNLAFQGTRIGVRIPLARLA